MSENNNNVFSYELGDLLCITASSENGVVIGKAKFEMGPDQYLLRYKNGNGVAVEAWWSETALDKTVPEYQS